MLKNAESGVELKGFDVDSPVIEHIQVNEAPEMQHRTYGAHGRINPRVSCPCHTETILLEKSRLFSHQKKRLHRRKRYPRRNGRWPGVNAA